MGGENVIRVARETMGDSRAARRRVKVLSMVAARAGPVSGCAFSDLCTWRLGFERAKVRVPPWARDDGISLGEGGMSGSEPAGVAVMKPANLWRGQPHPPSRAAQEGADQGSRRATTCAFATSCSRTRSCEEPVGACRSLRTMTWLLRRSRRIDPI